MKKFDHLWIFFPFGYYYTKNIEIDQNAFMC